MTRQFDVAVVLVYWNLDAVIDLDPPFGRRPKHPHDPAWYQQYLCDPDRPGIANFWGIQSQGELRMIGDVFPWFELKATFADLKHDTYNTIDREKVARLALAQAAARGHRIRGRDGWVVIEHFSPPEGVTLDAGTTSVTVPLPDGELPGSCSVLPAGTAFDFSAHEVGHLIGLNHSFGPQQLKLPTAQPGEYAHPACVMSAQWYGLANRTEDPRNTGLDPEYRSKGPGLNSASRASLGWLSAQQIDLDPGLDQSFALRALSSPAGGVNGLVLRERNGNTYTVELRSPRDPYDGGTLCPMIIVNAGVGGHADGVYPGEHCGTYLGEIHRSEPYEFVGPGFRVRLIAWGDDPKAAIVNVRHDPRAVYIEPYFPRQRRQVFVVDSQGALSGFLHNGRDIASAHWTGPWPLGSDWNMFTHIVPAPGNVLYGIKPNGDLHWYGYAGAEVARIRFRGGQRVGADWHTVKHVFAGTGGALYGVRPSGELAWFGHRGRAVGNDDFIGPRPVDQGWDGYVAVIPADDDVVYTISPNGELWWRRHLGAADGSASWAGPLKVGTGWHSFQRVFAGADGVIYAVQPDGTLLWYRHDGRRQGTFEWTGPRRVGSGWIKPAVFEGRP